MKKTGTLTRWAYVLASILATSACYFFSTGLEGIGALAWIAPVPILIIAFRSSAGLAATAAFVSYLLGGLNLVPYFARLFMPPGIIIAQLVFPALVFGLSVWITRRVIIRLRHWGAIFIFPALWTSYEYLFSSFSPHGTAGSLAYTQTDFTLLMQLASFSGIWGITFALTLFPATLAFAWHFRKNRKEALSAVAACLLIGLTVLAYGWVRIREADERKSVCVGLTTTDITVKHFNTRQPEIALPTMESYARRIGELADQGAEVIVLPEKFIGITPAYMADAVQILGKAAQSRRVTVVAGINWIGPENSKNIALVFGPDGRILLEYCKVHLVPGLEKRYRPGTTPGILVLSGCRAGVAICKDMDFPDWTIRYARQGTGVMLVPAWDFEVDGRWHSRMAVVRGIEGGFSVVRCAQEGRATASDRFGRILEEKRSSSAPEVLLVARVRPGPGHTFYSRSGNWFPWLALLFSAGLIVASIRPRRRNVGDSSTH